MIIYPDKIAGFDCVHARIHILVRKEGTGKFFHEYAIKSQKEKNSIVMKLNIQTLIEALRVLVDLGCSQVQFKLAQSPSGQKFFEVQGTSDANAVTNTQIEVEGLGGDTPQQLPQQEVEFFIDSATCSYVFAKFNKRLSFLQDEIAEINFFAGKQENQNAQEELYPYELKLNSDHMNAEVKQKTFLAKYADETDMKDTYRIRFKKEVFNKFFTCLKLPGTAVLSMTHDSEIEMTYTFDKCQQIGMVVYGATRKEMF